MHIITRSRLLEFSEKHPNTSPSLDAGYRIIKQNEIDNFSKLREIFPSADKVNNLTVFNIGGNKIRLTIARKEKQTAQTYDWSTISDKFITLYQNSILKS